MPHPSPRPLDEPAALEALDGLVDAFSRTDTSAYFGQLAPEATFLFHTEPAVVPDRAAYRALWDSWVASGWRVWRARAPTGRSSCWAPSPSSPTGCARPSAPPRVSSSWTSGRASSWPAAATTSSGSSTSTCPPPRPRRRRPRHEPRADPHRAAGTPRPGPAVDHRGRDARRRTASRTPNAPPARWICSASAFGGANTIATVVLGSFPIIFGLSFRRRRWPPLLGAGARRADPGADGAVRPAQRHQQRGLAPSAHLGVHGRVVGSFLSLLTAVAFFSHLGVDLRRRAGRRRQPAGRTAAERLAVYAVAYGIFAAPRARRLRLRLPVHAAGQQDRGRRGDRAVPASASSPSPATSTRRTPASSPPTRTRRPTRCSGRRSSAPR